MGTWGPAISSNDVFSDVKSSFIRLYNQGVDIAEIKQKILKDYSEYIEIYEDKHNFWFAFGLCCWECKSLDSDTLIKIKEIIDSKNNLDLWQELGATKADLKKRQSYLIKFLDKVSVEKSKARKRVEIKLWDSIFKKGDCIIYQLPNDYFGASIILKEEYQTENGLNLVLATDINQKTKPSIKEILKSNILYIKRYIPMVPEELKSKLLQVDPQLESMLPDEPEEYEEAVVSYYYASEFNNKTIKISVVGNIIFKPNTKKFNPGYCFNWDNLVENTLRAERNANSGGATNTVFKISKLVKRDFFSWFKS
jgi:hypothetical protein